VTGNDARSNELGGRVEIHGGRGGTITFTDGGTVGELEWEMLMGDTAMVIYAQRSHWARPASRPMTDDEVSRIAREVARTIRAAVEIQFAQSTRTVYPTAS